MGIKFYCPNGHKVNVKSFLAGKKGLCPKCGVRVDIPLESVADPAQPAMAGDRQTLTTDLALVDDDAEDEIEEVSALPAAVAAAPPVTQTTRTEPFSAGLGQPGGNRSPNPANRAAPQRSAVASAPLDTGLDLELPMPGSRTSNSDDVLLPASALPPASAQSGNFQHESGSKWHVQLVTGQQFNGIDDATLQQWISERRISPADLLWRDGWLQWQPASAVFSQGQNMSSGGTGSESMIFPTNSQPKDDFLAEALQSIAKPATSATWLQQRYRGKREIRATLSIVLLGLVVLLFALLLYVFFVKQQPESKQTQLPQHSVYAASFPAAAASTTGGFSPVADFS
jgi:hypothetical protein